MTDIVERLGEVQQHDRLTVDVDDGTTVEGTAAPVNFDPNDRLRIEIRPDDGDERYDLSATLEDGEWTPVGVRRQAGDADWEEVGEAVGVTRADERQFDDSASGADER